MSTDYRHEYKYRIHAGQAALLEARARAILVPDPHVQANGAYLIKSLYFDTLQDDCFYESEDGYDLRSKYRIRYYNDDPSFLRLEKKSKRNGMTRKESCRISTEQCRLFLSGTVPAVREDMPPVMKKLFTEMRLKQMVPKVIVIYERIPFVYPVGNVRVTFDRNLLSSNDIAGFLEPSITRRPVFPQGESLLEVKWDELLPDHICRHLSLESLQWTSFSKYYLTRKYNCCGGART